MKIVNYINDVELLAEGGGVSDDSRPHYGQIKFWITDYRGALMMKYTDYGKDIHAQLYQDMGVIPLTETDKSECPEIPFGCYVKKFTIPQLIEFPENRGWGAYLIDKVGIIVVSSPDVISEKLKNPYTQNIIYVYIIGTTVYVISRTFDLDYINFRGVFKDPTEVKKYCGEDEVLCFNEDTDEYPMPIAMGREIIQNIGTTELQLSLSTVEDILNNAHHEKR